jgi:DegV family protein with EDD domain
VSPPAPTTAVVCDTTAYLPDELIGALDIQRVSLYVSLEGETHAEADLADYDTFYDRLARSSEGASTSQPSVGDFLSVYEPLLAEGREVVSIHLSAGISGTCESALQARQRLIDEGKGGERVRVCDSRSGAGGMGLVALAGARVAAEGGDADAVLARAEETRAALKMWFAIDTLEYLRKGGRIGAAQAWIGSTLKIKPILTLEEEITPVERVRTRRRALERMVDFARELHSSGADGWVVQHIHDPEAAQTLVDHGRDVFGSEPLFVSEVGPVIGAHIGPGLLGIGGVPRALVEGAGG